MGKFTIYDDEELSVLELVEKYVNTTGDMEKAIENIPNIAKEEVNKQIELIDETIDRIEEDYNSLRGGLIAEDKVVYFQDEINKVNSQLNNKSKINNERIEVINDKTKTKGTLDLANFSGQGGSNNPIGVAIHNYTDGTPVQIDQVGKSGMGILVLKNATNPLRREDKESSYFGEDNFLNCRYQNETEEKPLFIINKDGNIERWNGTLQIKGGINNRENLAVEILDIYGERDILSVGVSGYNPSLKVDYKGIVINGTDVFDSNGVNFKGSQQRFINISKEDNGLWGLNLNCENKHVNAISLRNGGTPIATIGYDNGVDYLQANKCFKYVSQDETPSGLYGNTYYNQSTGYFYAYDKMSDSYRPFNEQYSSSAPTTGTWKVGQKVYNKTPTSGGYLGWVCISGGTPGIWKGFGLIEN